ncbi:MAG: hypothetical protein QOE80_3570 [Actinomycetota bacterium]|jgi:hypothetical protein|nr:hypothetical protein [Actinomycetota bacterium]
MVLDERARHELFLRLEQVLGPASAETLMELMPPVGWADVATKRDLDGLEERTELRFKASEQTLLAAFRGELLAQSNVITAQTRTLVMANLGAVLSVAVLAFGAARLT